MPGRGPLGTQSQLTSGKSASLSCAKSVPTAGSLPLLWGPYAGLCWSPSTPQASQQPVHTPEPCGRGLSVPLGLTWRSLRPLSSGVCEVPLGLCLVSWLFTHNSA